MIILYDANCKDFNNNGIGILKDSLKCEVSEALNGELVLDMEYPITSKYIEFIINENIIKCDAGLEEDQLFRIKHVKPNFDTITIYGEHISYDLADNFLEDVFPQNLNGAACLDWILSHTLDSHNFNSFSDIQTVSSARYVRKNPIEAIVGDLENSFVNLWGGELERNNYTIKMLNRRGNDKGYKIRYRKNLTGLDFTIDNSNIVTKIMPQGYNGLFLPEKYIDSPLINNYPHKKVKVIEFSDVKVKENADEEEGFATAEEAYQELRRLCNLKYSEENIDKPTVNLKVDFVDLSQTTEYQDYTFLESVSMGDTIRVELDYTQVEVRVIKTTYDALLHRYTKLELGEFKANYITDSQKDITNTIRKETDTIETSVLLQAKQNATEQLTAALGGYVYKTQNELFIMDTDNPNTAKKVWRWNLNGLGYSKNGINGPYELAMTQDGRIVADFITAGQMDVARIKGLNTLAIVASQIHLEGYTTINAGFAIDEKGNMTCNNATIKGGTIRLGDGTRENPTFIMQGTDGKQAWMTTDQFFIEGDLGNINLQCDSQLGIFIGGKNNKGNANLIGDDDAGMIGITHNTPTNGQQRYVDGFVDDNEAWFRVGNNGENKETIIYPDNIYVNSKPAIVSHAGVISLGYTYYTNGTDSNCGYLEIVTTNKGTVAASCWKSDGRLKKDIQESKVDALSVINSILHRSFKWKDNDGTEEIGYIAQELENVKSNFVFKVPQRDEDGNILDEVYQIDETKIIPFITKAIQELSSELEEQKAINKFLLKELGLEYKYKLSKTGEKVENLIVDALKDKIKQYDNQSIKFKEYIQEKREVMRKLVKQDDDSTTIILEEAKDEKNS
jgi:phage minor structural protein